MKMYHNRWEKKYQWAMVTISTVLLLTVSVVFSAGLDEKKDNKKSELVIASLDVFGPSNIPEASKSINRGEFITINVRLKNDRAAQSGPYKIRFYLSRNQDGADAAYEFDVFHDISLDKSFYSNGTNNNEYDSFHDVSLVQSGEVKVSGRYAFPFSMGAGYTYWVVVEIGPDERGIETDEKKITRITSVISVPCDQLDSYIDGDTYHCPFKRGKND